MTMTRQPPQNRQNHQKATAMTTTLFGLSQKCITPAPETKVSLAGYFNPRWQTGKLDDLFVRALAIADGRKIAVVCQFDLIRAPRVENIRPRCADIPGLDPASILFAGTHTHTAPGINPPTPGNDPAYEQLVFDQAVAAIHAAVADLKPGTACYTETEESRFAFNRRYWMKNGRVVTNPKRRDPEIDKPEGPIDPRIGLFGIKNPDGSLRLLIANISNHLDTIGGCLVSADWQAALRSELEQAIPGVRAWGMTSAAGNINHFDPNGGPDQSSYERSCAIGKGYAATALAAVPKLKDLPPGDLAIACRTIQVGTQEVPEADIQEARQTVAQYADVAFGTKNLTSEDLANRTPAALKLFAQRLLDIVDNPRTYAMECHVIRLGDFHVIGLCGEPFVEHAFHIREDILHHRPCIISAHCAGEAGYIPNRYNYGRGGYETQVTSSKTSLDTGRVLRQTIAELVAEAAAN